MFDQRLKSNCNRFQFITYNLSFKIYFPVFYHISISDKALSLAENQNN